MAIISFQEFLKMTDGALQDVRVFSPAERQMRISQLRQKAAMGETEFQRISSPLGQIKEFGKERVIY